tara:strand:- start:295 stop:1215 length:921 start_codon:yes stop_codon:yes gene_type:complete
MQDEKEFEKLFQIQLKTINARKDQFNNQLKLPPELYSNLNIVNTNSIVFSNVDELKQWIDSERKGLGVYFNNNIYPYFTNNPEFVDIGNLIDPDIRNKYFNNLDVRSMTIDKLAEVNRTNMDEINNSADVKTYLNTKLDTINVIKKYTKKSKTSRTSKTNKTQKPQYIDCQNHWDQLYTPIKNEVQHVYIKSDPDNPCYVIVLTRESNKITKLDTSAFAKKYPIDNEKWLIYNDKNNNNNFILVPPLKYSSINIKDYTKYGVDAWKELFNEVYKLIELYPRHVFTTYGGDPNYFTIRFLYGSKKSL